MSAPESGARAGARGRTVLKWTGIVLGAFIVVLLIAAIVLDMNADALRGPLARTASARLGRPVHIDGRLELHLFSWQPHAIIHGLRIANPGWVTAKDLQGPAPEKGRTPDNDKKPTAPVPPAPGDMARFGTLQLSLSIPALFKGDVLLPYVGIDDSEITVVRDAQQRFNWTFAPGAKKKPSNEPAKFPLLRSLHLGNGHLIVTDAIRKLHFNGTVSADQGPHGGAQSLKMDGDGDINGASFQLNASADPLITAESHKPYTVVSNIEAGKTKVQSRITLNKPFDMGSVVADISASGDDFADLYYLSGLALPNSAPYKVSGHMERRGSLLKVTNLQGTLGNSDIHGTLAIETARERPLVTADLATRELDIKDLAPALGSRIKTTPSSLSRKQAEPGQAGSPTGSKETAEQSSAKARAATPKAAKTTTAQAGGDTLHLHGAKPKSAQTRTAEARQADVEAAKGQTLLPDAKLDLRRIRAMDANVRYRADSVKTQKISIREIVANLKLENGVLTFTPASFVLPQGKLTSNIKVDGSKDVPEVEIDSRLTQVRLSQFKTKSGDEPIDGTLVGRIELHGRGKSMHEIGSTAAGNVSFVIPHGDIRTAFAEALGINAARALGLLLTGSQEKTGIRCGVANFKAEGGVFAAQDIVFDTDKMLILGKGEVDLGPEALDLSLTGQPKHFTFFRIKSPVEITGTLSHPKVGLKPGNTPGEVALATALGVLATPLASVLGFIDPGLAKDADCGGLIAEAEREGAPPVKNAPKDKDEGRIKDAQRSTKARSIT
jgi:AsmA family protein